MAPRWLSSLSGALAHGHSADDTPAAAAAGPHAGLSTMTALAAAPDLQHAASSTSLSPTASILLAGTPDEQLYYDGEQSIAPASGVVAARGAVPKLGPLALGLMRMRATRQQQQELLLQQQQQQLEQQLQHQRQHQRNHHVPSLPLPLPMRSPSEEGSFELLSPGIDDPYSPAPFLELWSSLVTTNTGTSPESSGDGSGDDSILSASDEKDSIPSPTAAYPTTDPLVMRQSQAPLPVPGIHHQQHSSQGQGVLHPSHHNVASQSCGPHGQGSQAGLPPQAASQALPHAEVAPSAAMRCASPPSGSEPTTPPCHSPTHLIAAVPSWSSPPRPALNGAWSDEDLPSIHLAGAGELTGAGYAYQAGHAQARPHTQQDAQQLQQQALQGRSSAPVGCVIGMTSSFTSGPGTPATQVRASTQWQGRVSLLFQRSSCCGHRSRCNPVVCVRSVLETCRCHRHSRCHLNG